MVGLLVGFVVCVDVGGIGFLVFEVEGVVGEEVGRY